MWELLKVHSVKSSVYQSQTDGLVKRCNQTLKGILQKFRRREPWDWDTVALIAIQGVAESFIGFFLLELLNDRQPQVVLDLLQEF